MVAKFTPVEILIYIRIVWLCRSSKCIVVCNVLCNCSDMNSVTSKEVLSNRSSSSGHLVVFTEQTEGCYRISVFSIHIFHYFYSAIKFIYCISILVKYLKKIAQEKQFFFPTTVVKSGKFVSLTTSGWLKPIYKVNYSLICILDMCNTHMYAQGNIFKFWYGYI